MTRPSIARCIAAALSGLAGLAFLIRIPPGSWPPRSPTGFSHWWVEQGPSQAAVTAVRAIGVVLACLVVVAAIAALGEAVAPHLRPLTLWRRITPTALRHILLVGTISAGTLSLTSGAGADEPPPLVLRDLGPAPSPRDLTEAPLPVPEPEPAPDRVAASDTWVVARGDHLWAVAEATLRDHGRRPDVSTVAAYWTRLIEANRAIVGDDPDLIHPGEVLVLPRVDLAVRAGS